MERVRQTIGVDMSEINVYPGQWMTVWLNRNPKSGNREALQVELRVKEDGTPEIFSFCKQIELKDFDDWYDGDPLSGERS